MANKGPQTITVPWRAWRRRSSRAPPTTPGPWSCGPKTLEAPKSIQPVVQWRRGSRGTRSARAPRPPRRQAPRCCRPRCREVSATRRTTLLWCEAPGSNPGLCGRRGLMRPSCGPGRGSRERERAWRDPRGQRRPSASASRPVHHVPSPRVARHRRHGNDARGPTRCAIDSTTLSARGKKQKLRATEAFCALPDRTRYLSTRCRAYVQNLPETPERQAPVPRRTAKEEDYA